MQAVSAICCGVCLSTLSYLYRVLYQCRLCQIHVVVCVYPHCPPCIECCISAGCVSYMLWCVLLTGMWTCIKAVSISVFETYLELTKARVRYSMLHVVFIVVLHELVVWRHVYWEQLHDGNSVTHWTGECFSIYFSVVCCAYSPYNVCLYLDACLAVYV